MPEIDRRPLVSRRISVRPQWKIQWACGAILAAELFERIAFYALVGNLVLFLNTEPMNWQISSATNASLFLTGFSHTAALLGGWIADSFLGRFKTIVLFLIVYIVGYTFMPLFYPYPSKSMDASVPPAWCSGENVTVNVTLTSDFAYNNEYKNRSTTWPTMPTMRPANDGADMICGWAVFLALGIIGLGNACVKANIAPFGADQLRTEGPNREKLMRGFFNWFYWCVNIASFIALGAIGYVQQEISFFWGFVCPAISLVLALVVFIVGSAWYSHVPPGGSLLSNIFRVILEACRSCKRNGPPSSRHGLELPAPSCLDMAKVRYGGSFHDNLVEDVKVLGRILLIFLSLIPYWIVYFQMETTFVVQGIHMRLDFNHPHHHNSSSTAYDRPDHFQVPAVWLSLFDIIFIIILLPIMDRVIYPLLDRYGASPSIRARMAIGMCFAIGAVCLAGGLEMYRYHVFWKDGVAHPYNQKIGNSWYRAADVSILWQIPQYGLIGISEVFASVAGLELAYSEAPRSLRGIMMGLFWFCQGLGSIVGTFIMSAFQGVWLFAPDHGDINCRHQRCKYNRQETCRCHLDYYFFFLALLQFFGLLLFILAAWKMNIGGNDRNRERSRSDRTNSRASRDSISEDLPSRNLPRTDSLVQVRERNLNQSEVSISSDGSLIAA